MEPEDKLAELHRITAEQNAKHKANLTKITSDTSTTIDETDTDRLLILDRIAEQMPDLDLRLHEAEWRRFDDGIETLLVDGGGIDGGTGYMVSNGPIDEDLHVIGPTDPLFPGKIVAVSIHPDGSRKLAKLIPDPLVEWRRDESDAGLN